MRNVLEEKLSVISGVARQSSPIRSAGKSDGSTIFEAAGEILVLTYLIAYNCKVLTAKMTVTFELKRTGIPNERSWESPKFGVDCD